MRSVGHADPKRIERPKKEGRFCKVSFTEIIKFDVFLSMSESNFHLPVAEFSVLTMPYGAHKPQSPANGVWKHPSGPFQGHPHAKESSWIFFV